MQLDAKHDNKETQIQFTKDFLSNITKHKIDE